MRWVRASHMVASATSFVFLCSLVMAPLARAAQDASPSEFEQDLRLQGYFFGGPAWMNNVGSSLVEFGGGFDFLVNAGLGLGGEGSILSDGSSAIAAGGFNVSYHFLPESPGIEPFVVGGMSFGGGAEFGLSGYTWVTAGGGINILVQQRNGSPRGGAGSSRRAIRRPLGDTADRHDLLRL